MKATALPILLILISGCSIAPLRTSADYLAIAQTSLITVERGGGAVAAFVVPPSIGPQARSTLASLHKVVTPDAVPQSEQFILPKGYFTVKTFTVVGNEATFVGTLGPLLRETGSVHVMSCGANFSFHFTRKNGSWQSDDVKWYVC